MRLFAKIDLMVRLLLLAILLASVLPATGEARLMAQWVSNAAIFVLFLLNGLRLPRHEVMEGLGHSRFLLPVALWCFGAMALFGKGLAVALSGALPPLVALGFLYLGVLPSTVQSATAYSSLAGGNVSRSVVAAALTNIVGVFACAPLFAALGGGGAVELGLAGLGKVFGILILPFAIGQVLQGRLRSWVDGHRGLVTWMDRLSIAIAVYVAFSGAVEQGLWTRVGVGEWALLLGAVSAMLVFAFAGSWGLGGAIGLGRPERVAFLFAGAHKSVAMGAPLAAVLFPPQVAGMVLLPLLAYHLLQLVVSAPIANRLAARPGRAPDCAG
ncbi:bile acid:sodium symporter [Tsuneonella sp. YG55]|uniref:Bile acid:sodium symporter n=1 Tax=Tsuneonella litorea TaxID=2976475 RepID=A0A9X2W138_9SPHN|nr:bile acid:sodium symporter family protein [Tsuneonella litorea]MCT2558101.1 bile acid:sodium symporter [Tsuneonella litorea]